MKSRWNRKLPQLASASATICAALLWGNLRASGAKNLDLPPISSQDAIQSSDMDSLIQKSLTGVRVPGLVATFVKRGRPTILSATGMADLEHQIPMNPETDVRAGSVSKVITSIAVLQLIEAGKVHLGEDIRSYLKDVPVELYNGKPITIANLLTHTAGFPDLVVGMHAHTLGEWQPLEEYTRAHLPRPIMEPGKRISYSSWDYALLGLVIQDVSGLPFPEYMDKNVFEPLHMNQSSFRVQDLPKVIVDHLATGYVLDGDKKTLYPRDYVKPNPGISLYTTAEDMSHFISMLLQGGMYENNRIASEQALNLIFSIQFRQDPALLGRSYALAETWRNGHQVFFHDGNGIGFSSRLIVAPDLGAGAFVSVNHGILEPGFGFSKAAHIPTDVTNAYIDSLPPGPGRPLLTAIAVPPAAKTIGKGVGGSYITTTYARHSVQKLMLYFEQFRVKTLDGGALLIDGVRYHSAENNVYEAGAARATFALDDGHLYLYMERSAYQKLRFWQLASTHVEIVIGIFLAFLLGLTTSIFAVRRRDRAAYFSTIVSVAGLAIIAYGGLELFTMDPQELFYGTPYWFKIVGMLSLALLVLSILQIMAGTNRSNRARQISTTANLCGALLLIALLTYWQVLPAVFA